MEIDGSIILHIARRSISSLDIDISTEQLASPLAETLRDKEVSDLYGKLDKRDILVTIEKGCRRYCALGMVESIEGTDDLKNILIEEAERKIEEEKEMDKSLELEVEYAYDTCFA